MITKITIIHDKHTCPSSTQAASRQGPATYQGSPQDPEEEKGKHRNTLWCTKPHSNPPPGKKQKKKGGLTHVTSCAGVNRLAEHLCHCTEQHLTCLSPCTDRGYGVPLGAQVLHATQLWRRLRTCLRETGNRQECSLSRNSHGEVAPSLDTGNGKLSVILYARCHHMTAWYQILGASNFVA